MSLNKMMVGEKVRLLAFTPQDMEKMVIWYQDSDFSRNLDMSPAFPRTLESMQKEYQSFQDTSRSFAFAIKTHSDSQTIGFVSLESILWSHGASYLAVGLAPDQQNKGYGREALELILDFAFLEVNLHRVGLTVFEYNARAIHLYESLGFVREGICRETLKRDGQRWDVYYYGLLAEEWLK